MSIKNELEELHNNYNKLLEKFNKLLELSEYSESQIESLLEEEKAFNELEEKCVNWSKKFKKE